ncbi:MAG: hypothetical protein U0269_24495 [Polyangiales bacterium]
MTIAVEPLDTRAPRARKPHALRSIAHLVLSATTLITALFLALWSHVADPAQGATLRSTHGIASWVALVPLLMALAANGALAGAWAPDRSFARVRSAALALHGLSFASLLLAANDRATEYGITLATSYSVEHARGSVLWVLLAIAAAAASSAASSIVVIATLHYGRDNVWSDRDAARWALYIAAFVSALSASATLLWTLLVAAERITGVGVFEPTLGGHVLRFQQMRALWAQPVLVSTLLVAMGAVDHSLARRAERDRAGALEIVGAPRRWPYVWMALCAPFGFSPVEAWWHESSIVLMASSFLGLMFYGPLAVVLLRWLRLLALARTRWSVSFVGGVGAVALVSVNASLGALLSVASVGPGYALTTLPTALSHGLAMSVLAVATVMTVDAKVSLDHAREASWAAVAVVVGSLIAWGATVLAGARTAMELRGPLAAIVSIGSVFAAVGALSIAAMGARARLSRH